MGNPFLQSARPHTSRILAPRILAVETAVVDLHYPEHGGNDGFKREFFAHLREYIVKGGGTPAFTDNPRGGDMCMVLAEDLDQALIAFGRENGLADQNTSEQAEKSPKVAQALAAQIRDVIFGAATASAGGSLANSFHALSRATLNGKAMVEGVFATAIGADDIANAFHDSLAPDIYCNRGGRQMACHVFPIDGDRILITTPSQKNPAERLIDADLVNGALLKPYDRIMLGGFLFFTPGFDAVFDALEAHLSRRPRGQRPSLALTAAAQSVSAAPAFRARVWRMSALADTVIHANTGEFRRLMAMDDAWRTPFDADFAGLRGQALDHAKDQHAPYQSAKREANKAAMEEAVRRAQDHLKRTGLNLRFVVTDGARGIYTISPQGIETLPPHKITRAQIVSTVGAGDNFAAGFQLGDLYKQDAKISMMLGRDFARAIIQSPDARIPSTETKTHAKRQFGGALSAIAPETLAAMAAPIPKPAQGRPRKGPKPPQP